MRKKRNAAKAVCMALAITVLATLGFATGASAKLVGEFTKFQYCPWKTAEVSKCLYALTEGGEVDLGKKVVKIENDVLLQGGFGKPNKETKMSKFFAATNGITLAKVKQNVPGGLLGIVPPEKSPWLVKALSAFFFENSLTGVNSILELAKPATDIEISELNMSRKEGVAMKLPVKVRLENPFLGSKCYVGSDASPIYWKLTSGKTAPSAPNTTIEGSAGKLSFHEEGLILRLTGNKLVENNWAAPGASGCGGLISFLVNPIINSQVGLPAAAGNNSAVLENTVDITTAAAMKFIDESNP